MRAIFSLILLLFVSSSLNAQDLVGTYEQVIENRSKQVLSIEKVNNYEEVEYRWYDGKWVLKCRYIGMWSVVGDTLILRPLRVVWANKRITTCKDQGAPEQPGCCFSYNYFYDDKSIWSYGVISKTKYVFEKVKTKGK